jgi:DNA transformation protein and related proteins
MTRQYCDYIIDMLAPWAHVSARKMFGGFGLYRSDLMFAIVLDDVLYFKAGDGDLPDYKQAGSAPFTYEAKGRRVSLSYWRTPEEVLEDEAALCAWAGKAYEAAIGARTTKAACGFGSLGPKSKAWLKEIGVETDGDLRALGAVEAYRRLKEHNPKVTLNMLWGLHAALEGGSWRDIDAETKARLTRAAGGKARK